MEGAAVIGAPPPHPEYKKPGQHSDKKFAKLKQGLLEKFLLVTLFNIKNASIE